MMHFYLLAQRKINTWNLEKSKIAMRMRMSRSRDRGPKVEDEELQEVWICGHSFPSLFSLEKEQVTKFDVGKRSKEAR